MTGASIWLTGQPAAGKSTLALALLRRLQAAGREVDVLDGDAIRATVSADLGFSADHRRKQTGRVAAMALERVVGGRIAIVALVSPFRDAREAARQRHREAGVPFVEVWVDTPLAVCEERDPKGLYRRARAGQLEHMTGLDDPYEPPPAPEVRVGSMASDEVVAILASLLDDSALYRSSAMRGARLRNS